MAVKIIKVILKILILTLTAIWGVVFGIFSPLLMMSYDIVDFPIANHPVFIVWIIMGVVGYILPCVFIMLKYYKTGCIFSLTGTVMTLIIHSVLMGLKEGNYEISPSFLYLPQVFMTILTVIITAAANFDNILYANSKRKLKYDAPSPSVLGENSITDKNENIKK